MDYDSRGQTPREAARGSIRKLVEAGLLSRVESSPAASTWKPGATNTLCLLQIGTDGRARAREL